VIGSGPYTLNPGESRMLGFALVGGADLPALQANADAARSAWTEIVQLVPVPDPEPALPLRARLVQNYPNPFNPATVIRYEISEGGPVRVAVFDALGREVRTLADGFRPAGRHAVEFDAGGLSSGVYFCRLTAGGYTETRRMMLIR
jgi:hypothetical protein